jgi:hypothetical protein
MPKNIRPIRIEGNIAFVSLTKGYTAVIDAIDVPIVDGFFWIAKEHKTRGGDIQTVYATSGIATLRLHRLITSAPAGLEVDHIDGDGLNNRRANLRLATKAQNMKNRRPNRKSASGVKGVTWHKQNGKWQAQIMSDKDSHYLGYFETIEAAAKAYAEASVKLHGDFGRSS